MISNRRLFAACLAAILTTGCGGRAPNPVSQYLPGDEQRSCTGLKTEIANNETDIARLIPYEDATGKNVALGVVGVFLIVPWFFMDFKEGEAIELQALRRHNQWLREVAADNDCYVPPSSIVFEDEPEDGRENGPEVGREDGGG